MNIKAYSYFISTAVALTLSAAMITPAFSADAPVHKPKIALVMK
jgi:ribose transport system substrate-binding protein